MSSDEKIKSILSDLGRATLRGVRRCPKCSAYNGTRCISCKKCNCSLKEKRKFNSEACRLVTGNATQIYSVRVDDKGPGPGPENRGFVQLPLVAESDSFVLSESASALCFVDTCQRLFHASILKCHESEQCLAPMCQHIEAAIKCSNEATVLIITLTDTMFTSLHIGDHVKQEIYQLASQSSAPLVQRVSKNVMAVKCQVSPKHPLGYLHFSFSPTKAKEKSDLNYHCSCTDFKGQNKTITGQNQTDINSPIYKKCVHFYACICAFASDVKLAEEFACYLSSEVQEFGRVMTMNVVGNGNGRELCDIEVEVAPAGPVHVQNLEIDANGEVTIIRALDPLHFTGFTDFQSSLQIVPPKKSKNDAVSKIQKQLKNTKKLGKPWQLSADSVQKKKLVHLSEEGTLEEKRTQLSFVQWLSSVTERINQTMHYQFSGKPEPLIFHVPQMFFDCLRERISSGGTKKRLPNFTNAFIRKDAIPMGTFTKYTWHITNILHVKQIFETPLISLQITKSFVQNSDGTYELYIRKGDENDGLKKGMIPIKPLELKTYLAVGHTSHNQTEPTPFIIEWIPDILPLSHVGELRLRFQFGHERKHDKPFRIPTKPNLNHY